MNSGKLMGALRAVVAIAVLAVPTAALTQQTPAPAPADQAQASPAPAPKPYEEIIKLWKGNLSEDFIKRKIERDAVVYDLTADDIIKCKAANLPESLIEAMMSSGSKPAAAPAAAAKAAAPVAGAAPVVVAAGVTAPPPPAPAPNLAAQADRSWEGIVRRNDGVVLFKSRWDNGKLTFRDQKLYWFDADEEKKNLILTGKAVKEQFLVCLKGSQADPECFEWGLKTDDGEYRFRDVGWERADSTKPQEIFDFFKAIYPNLVSATYPADKK